MNIGEIKAEALKLMFAGYDSISEGTVSGLSANENYSVYLDGMVGSINRCLADLESKDALPAKRVCLRRSAGQITGSKILFDLSALSVGRILRVSAFQNDSYFSNCPYDLEEDTLILDGGEDRAYVLIYRPRAKKVSLEDSDNTDVGLPDSVACLIPYYVKGDLYRDDEPSEAAEARNYYEAGVAALVANRKEDGAQGSVENRYDFI